MTARASDGAPCLPAGRRALTVEAGTGLAAVISASLQRGWAGLETLSGIPGTVGGAVVGNAGAYGHAISECVDEVEIFDPRTVSNVPHQMLNIRWLDKADCQFTYRDSIFKYKNYLILRVKLQFQAGDRVTLEQKSAEIIKIREKKYQPGLACPGSFFKNVLVSDVSAEGLNKIDQTKIIEHKIPAGYLLEQVGAKGLKTAHLEVADFHGNLIINRGGATAAEVKQLAKELRQKVQKRFGIMLEEEVRYLPKF